MRGCALDVEGGNNHLVEVHVRGVLEEDGLVGGPAGYGSPHAGGHVGEDRRCDAAQDERPHQLDLGGGADYGPPVPWLRPVTLLEKGWTRLAHSGGMGAVPVTTSDRQATRRRLTGRVRRWYDSAGKPATPGTTPFF